LVDDLRKESGRSYSYLIEDGYFSKDEIKKRYATAFKDIETLLDKYGLTEYCTVSPILLWHAMMDLFADLARVKQFHEHKELQVEKEYSYEVYWILRSRPIQTVQVEKIPSQYVHVNEFIMSKWLIAKMAEELKWRFEQDIQVDELITKLESHEIMKDFCNKLHYTFRYRPYTAQSLLLTIEGFMAAAGFTLYIT